MTLHPWPLDDNSTADDTTVFWTGHRGCGLLSDSLAVPLRFMPSPANAAWPAPSTVETAVDVFSSTALLCLRDIGTRFGSGR